MRTLGVIPARLAATRLPNKPLLDIAGKPMIQWVWERSRRSSLLDDVIVATPDFQIIEVCKGFGAKAILTRPDHPTGTDRVAEAVADMDAEIVVNIQGDEPMTEPDGLDALIQGLQGCEEAALASLMFVLEPGEAADPNLVKVVVDGRSRALYFSRAEIPYPRSAAEPKRFGHVGIYAWRRGRLMEFPRLQRGQLEAAESLEQLRALEAGWKILMVQSPYRPVGVDTEQDLERARSMLAGV